MLPGGDEVPREDRVGSGFAIKGASSAGGGPNEVERFAAAAFPFPGSVWSLVSSSNGAPLVDACGLVASEFSIPNASGRGSTTAPVFSSSSFALMVSASPSDRTRLRVSCHMGGLPETEKSDFSDIFLNGSAELILGLVDAPVFSPKSPESAIASMAAISSCPPTIVADSSVFHSSGSMGL